MMSVERGNQERQGRGAECGRGFTLVELQIAIVIMAMISLLLLGALRLTSQTWSKVTERQDRAEHQFLVSQLLRRHLSMAQYFTVRLAAGETSGSFIGGPNYLHYVAPFPSFYNDGVLYWWSLKIVWDEGYQRDVLVLDYQIFDKNVSVSLSDGGLDVEGQSAQRLVLESKIESVALSYFFDDIDRGPEWREEWFADELKGRRLPSLLSMQLSVENGYAVGGVQTWPAVVLAPLYVNEALN